MDKRFIQGKKRSLEKINRYDVIHKEDVISFKIFSPEGFIVIWQFISTEPLILDHSKRQRK